MYLQFHVNNIGRRIHKIAGQNIEEEANAQFLCLSHGFSSKRYYLISLKYITCSFPNGKCGQVKRPNRQPV
jgi:hypothetical protein